VRYAWITRHRRQWPISVQCEVLGVSASGYFDHVAGDEFKTPPKPGRRLSDEAVLAHIKAAHAGSRGEYGWPRVWKDLLSKGVRVGKDRIQKLMKQHGIKARGKRRYVLTTDSRHNLPVAANLLDRRFQPERPDAVWTSDITYSTPSQRSPPGWGLSCMSMFGMQCSPELMVQ
jgi:putative transposase